MAKFADVPAYRIKVSLLDVTPPVWRRVVVPGSSHLGKVHDVVQAAFGWADSHLHGVRAGRAALGNARSGLGHRCAAGGDDSAARDPPRGR